MPILKRDEIKEEWSVLIEGAQGRAGYILGTTGNAIDQSNVPDINVEKRKMAMSLLGFFGDKRDFLIVTNTKNARLRPFQMFIGARDYGNYLDVLWFVTYRFRFFDRLWDAIAKIPVLNLILIPFSLMRMLGGAVKEKKIGYGLDFFDEQDLRAYLTVAHKCVQNAVDNLMLELNQDPSKIDRKSRGFLGIS
ncbi:MAG: hypothetical protein WC081_04085 [Candidatus Ratteibacteria bacterium]|jgi:hypothetical protein